jgi:hypothetical protein
LNLKKGAENIPTNMIKCYQNLIDLGLVDRKELDLLNAWFRDVELILKNIKNGKE